MAHELFVSYSRRDNTQGRITDLVGQITTDYERFTGEPLSCFFDVESIAGMDDWRHRILSGLRESHLFLLMLSPGYLQSEYCEWEIVECLKYEHGRAVSGQGVAPIYFVEIPGFEDPDFETRAAEWLVRVRRHNWVDLRPWYDEGRTALQRQEVSTRLSDLQRSLSSRLSRLRSMANIPGNTPPHNPAFVGRETEMQRLHEAAALGQLGVLVTVHGVGGLGKTALAMQYAYAYADFYPGGRWLVGCAGKPSLAAAIRSLDIDLGLNLNEEDRKDDDRAVRRVLHRLRELSEENAAARAGEPDAPAPRALLILDNIDDPSLLQPPDADLVQGKEWLHVIATTRLGPDALGYGDEAPAHPAHRFLAVDELPVEDALRLIESYQRGGRFDDESEARAARELVALLGGFTLAVEVAAVYLGEHAGRISCAAFVERLRAEGLAGLETAAQDARARLRHTEKLVTMTLGPTLDGLTPPERLILEISALLPPDSIALPWVRAVAGDRFPNLAQDASPGHVDPWLDAVNHLLGLRLLQVVERDEAHLPRLCRLHRLVKAVVAERTPIDSQNLVARLAEHAEARFEFLEEEWLDWDNRWEIDPLADFSSELLVSGHPQGSFLANQAGVVLERVGQFGAAELLLRGVLAHLEESHGPDHPDTLTALYNLGCLLTLRDDLDRAEPLCGRALEGRARVLGPDHPDTLMTMYVLGILLGNRGDYARAEDLCRRALEAQERVLGPDHPHTLSSLANLARLLKKKGDYAAAEPIYRRVLEVRERLSGPDHPSTLSGLNNLATFLEATGDLQAAEPLYRRALEGLERILGPHHPDTLNGVVNLGVFLRNKGDHAEAVPLLRKGLEGMTQVLGQSHSRTLRALNHLADLHETEGRAEEALALRRRAIETRATGPDLTPEAARQLALQAYRLGDSPQAESLLQRTLSAEFEIPGTHVHLCRIHLATGELEGARRHAGEAWQHRAEAPPYVVSRILWLRLLFVFIDGGDASPILGALKTALQNEEAHMEWSMQPALDQARTLLPPDSLALLTALVTALGDRERLTDLEAFNVWREQPPLPLD